MTRPVTGPTGTTPGQPAKTADSAITHLRNPGSWDGTAPTGASSGEQVRHRLSRAGNRQINRVLHIMAVVQLRHRNSEGRAYYDRKVAAGKTPREAMRSLKRRLPASSTTRWSSTRGRRQRAREDTWGRLLAPARPAPTPSPALRRSHVPDPPHPTLRPPTPFFALLPPPPIPAGPQPPSSALCLTTARTGAHSRGGNNDPLDTEGSQKR